MNDQIFGEKYNLGKIKSLMSLFELYFYIPAAVLLHKFEFFPDIELV